MTQQIDSKTAAQMLELLSSLDLTQPSEVFIASKLARDVFEWLKVVEALLKIARRETLSNLPQGYSLEGALKESPTLTLAKSLSKELGATFQTP